MKRIPVLLALLLSCIIAAAQDCYNYTRSQGMAYYDKGEYRTAKERFTTAKDCPDKPAGNDLDFWIEKCNAAIKEAESRRAAEAERKRRIEREQELRRQENAQREAAASRLAGQGYMNILGIDFGTEGKDETTSVFGNTLQASDVKYLVPRIHYDGLTEDTKRIKVDCKLIRPDGTLMSGTSSPEGYTFSCEISVFATSDNRCRLSGYGTESGGSYKPGKYRIELWHSGNRIYQQDFTLQGPVSATYLKVDGKTSVSSVYSPDGGSETYYVSTDGPSYDVTLLPGWCQLTSKTESSFTIQWSANNTGNSRSDWFRVESGSCQVRVDVSQAAKGPSAEISKVWVDHNYFYGGMKGMMIHVKFSTYNMKGKSGNCNAYFYFSDGTVLKDFNQSYRSVDGQVSVGESFVPSYDSSEFSDFKLFLPYSELHMPGGSYSLKFFIQIFYNGSGIATSDYVSFTYSS